MGHDSVVSVISELEASRTHRREQRSKLESSFGDLTSDYDRQRQIDCLRDSAAQDQRLIELLKNGNVDLAVFLKPCLARKLSA